MDTWIESDKLQAELDALLGEEVELTDVAPVYSWTPPNTTGPINDTPTAITLTKEDSDMFSKYERQLAEVTERQNEALARQDPLYRAIEDGVIDEKAEPAVELTELHPEMPAPNMDTIVTPEAENLAFQQEFSNPGWFRRTFFKEKPVPVGLQPKYEIESAWEDVIAYDLPQNVEMMTLSREMKTVLPNNTGDGVVSQAESMIGTGVSPVDVQEFQHLSLNHAKAVEAIESEFPISNLPSLPNESIEMSTNYVESELLQRTVPLELGDLDEMDMEQWAEQEFGDPFESYMQQKYPNFNYSMNDDLVEQSLSGEMADYEFSSIYTSALDAALSNAIEIGEFGFWDALSALGMGMLEIGGAGALLIASSQLIPLIQRLKDPHWNSPGYYQNQANIIKEQQRLQDELGTHYLQASTIRGYYETTPTYVWVKDNGIMGQHNPFDKTQVWGYGGQMSDLSWTYKVMPGTGLWKRARIITAEGRGTGLDDSKDGIWVYLKFCDANCDTSVSQDIVSCWFRIGVDGVMLPDDTNTRHTCTIHNLAKLNVYRPTPGKSQGPKTSDVHWEISEESDMFPGTTSKQSDKLQELLDSVLQLQESVPYQSDVWWDLEDARYKTYEDKDEIRAAIRKANEYLRDQRRADKPRPVRPNRDRRPIFNATESPYDQNHDLNSAIINQYIPNESNIDMGAFEDHDRHKELSVALQGTHGYVEPAQVYNIHFDAIRRRLPELVPNTVVDWFFDDSANSGIIYRAYRNQSRFLKDWKPPLWETIRNIATMLKTFQSVDDLEVKTDKYFRFKTVRKFLAYFPWVMDQARTKSGRQQNLERFALIAMIGRRAKPLYDKLKEGKAIAVYQEIFNPASAKYNIKKKEFEGMRSWLEWTKYLEDTTPDALYGNIVQLFDMVMAKIANDNESRTSNFAFAFLPKSLRYGVLRKEDMTGFGGRELWDIDELIEKLSFVLDNTADIPSSGYVASKELIMAPQPLPNSFMLENRPRIIQTIQILQAWKSELLQAEGEARVPINVDDGDVEIVMESQLAPRSKENPIVLDEEEDTRVKTEDPMIPSLQPELLDEPSYPAESLLDLLAVKKEMKQERIQEQSQPFADDQEDESDPIIPSFNAVASPEPAPRRSQRTRNAPTYNLDVLAKQQMSELEIVQFSRQDVLNAYNRYLQDIERFMNGPRLNDSSDMYSKAWRTLSEQDPIIPMPCFSKITADGEVAGKWEFVFPSARIEENAIEPEEFNDLGYEYDAFNEMAGEGSRVQIAIAMKIKEVVYRMMTIRTQDGVNYEAILSNRDYQISKAEQEHLNRNLELVKSLFENERWSTKHFPAPFELDTIDTLPPMLNCDLKYIALTTSGETRAWCEKVSHYLKEESQRFADFDEQVNRLNIQSHEFSTIDAFEDELQRIQEDVLPEMEKSREFVDLSFNVLPAPQLFPVSEQSKKTTATFDPMIFAAGLALAGILIYNS